MAPGKSFTRLIIVLPISKLPCVFKLFIAYKRPGALSTSTQSTAFRAQNHGNPKLDLLLVPGNVQDHNWMSPSDFAHSLSKVGMLENLALLSAVYPSWKYQLTLA